MPITPFVDDHSAAGRVLGRLRDLADGLGCGLRAKRHYRARAHLGQDPPHLFQTFRPAETGHAPFVLASLTSGSFLEELDERLPASGPG